MPNAKKAFIKARNVKNIKTSPAIDGLSTVVKKGKRIKEIALRATKPKPYRRVPFQKLFFNLIILFIYMSHNAKSTKLFLKAN